MDETVKNGTRSTTWKEIEQDWTGRIDTMGLERIKRAFIGVPPCIQFMAFTKA